MAGSEPQGATLEPSMEQLTLRDAIEYWEFQDLTDGTSRNADHRGARAQEVARGERLIQGRRLPKS